MIIASNDTIMFNFKIMKCDPTYIYYIFLLCIGIYIDQKILFGFINILGLSSAMTNYITHKYHGEKNIKTNLNVIIFTLFCIIGPITEEYLFRHALYNDFSLILNKNYAAHITSILFGIIHLSNYFMYKYYLQNQDKSLFSRTMLQVMHTTIIGYALSSTNSLLHCVYYHSYYNTFVILLMNKFSHSPEKNNVHAFSFEEMVYIPKRRHSYPKIINKNKYDDYHSIKVTKELYDKHYLYQQKLSH